MSCFRLGHSTTVRRLAAILNIELAINAIRVSSVRLELTARSSLYENDYSKVQKILTLAALKSGMQVAQIRDARRDSHGRSM